jgi:phosphate acetyltransferase
VLKLLLEHDTANLSYEDCIGVSYERVHSDPDGALTDIVSRFAAVERACDAVLILGSDFTDIGSPTELSYNARIAANLGAPVLLVLGGRKSEGEGARTADDMRQVADLTTAELREQHAGLLAVVVNRADPKQLGEIEASVAAAVSDSVPVWAIPEDPFLVAPTLDALIKATDARLLWGDPALLEREALGVVVAAMSMENVLTRLTEGAVVVAPGDRADVLVGVLLAHSSGTFPSLTGVILNGGFELAPQVQRLVSGIGSTLPIAMCNLGTYDVLRRIAQTRGRLAADSPRKYDTARALFDEYVDADELLRRLQVSPSSVVTPLMFEYGLLERARENLKHIVLPEGKTHHPRLRSDRSRARDRTRARHQRRRRDRPVHLRPAGSLCRRVCAHPLAQGRDGRAGQRYRHRRLLFRHFDGAPGTRRRNGVGRRSHDRQHDPTGLRDHPNQARRLRGLERVPHGPRRSGARLR